MKKLAIMVAVLAMTLMGFAPIEASADAPIVFEDSSTFQDVQPCSGELIDITINVEVRLHPGHPNNFVVNLTRSGSTSDGSVTLSGTQSFNENNTGFRAHLNDIWVNPETGERFQALGIIVVKFADEEAKVDSFRLRCLGN